MAIDRGIKILDCTLRDGGFYNNWEFNDYTINSIINSLKRSNIDIVELGYKSLNTSGYAGRFKYCPEVMLTDLKESNDISFAYMIDVKEFIVDGKIDRAKFRKITPKQTNSVFNLCRLAGTNEMVPYINEMAHILKESGYNVSFNYMSISLLSENDILKSLKILDPMVLDVIYFADSYGSFKPEDIARLCNTFKQNIDVPFGFHAHDNQGLAYANSLIAINNGVEYIDATIMGMGRGAGNLKLEQLLLGLFHDYGREDLDPYALLDIIEGDMKALQEKYRWGWDFSYMLSGLENIHQSYCQKLKSSHQYTIKDVTQILNDIPKEERKKYNVDSLVNSSEKILKSNHFSNSDISIPGKPTFIRNKEVLVLARGENAITNRKAIVQFVKKRNIYVMECNNTESFYDLERTIVFLNRIRYDEMPENLDEAGIKEIICGFNNVDNIKYEYKTKYLEAILSSNNISISNNSVTIPGFLVGQYALTIALSMNPEKIYIAGFDGYVNVEKSMENIEMQIFWEMYMKKLELDNVELISLTDTEYAIPVTSVYSLI